MPVKKKLVWLIVIATLARCLTACSVELGNDEVYYLSYARHLQWNYFDHPPMVALLIRLTTFNLHFTNEFFIRIGPIVLAAINTHLIYRLIKKIKNEQAGFIAALLFTASPYCSIIAGTFILPDSPQLFFWILSLFQLVKIVLLTEKSKQLNKSLLLFGLLSGLCIMCKVHGIFLWFGFGLYILLYRRHLFANLNLYAAAIITVVIISPVLIWNIQNNFITYTFHSGRISMHNGLQLDGFLREIAGGILYNNPISYCLLVFALTHLFKKINFIDSSINKILLLLSLPLILLLFIISLSRDTLPHWSGPAYIPLIIITACYISYKLDTTFYTGKRLLRITYVSVLFLSVVIATAVLLVNFMPGTIGKKDPAMLGDGDFTLDMYGWKGIKKDFKKVYDRDIAAGKTSTTFIISNKWFPGAHIDNYIAQPLHLDFIAIGELNDIHTYAWLNQCRKKIQAGDDAYCITISNNYFDPNLQYKALFESIEPPVVVPQFRGGIPVRTVLLYLLKHYKGN